MDEAEAVRPVIENGRDRLLGLFRESGVLYVGGGLTVVLTLAQQLTTARFLGPSGYGKLAIVTGSVTVAFLVLDIRSWEVATRLLAAPIRRDDHDEVLRIAAWTLRLELLTGFLGGGLLVVTSPLVARHLLNQPSASWIVAAAGVAVAARVAATGMSTAVIRLAGRFRWLAVKSVGYAGARLLLITSPVALGWGFTGAAGGVILSEVINATVVVLLGRAALRTIAPHGTLPLWRSDPPAEAARGRRLIPSLWLSASLKALQLETFLPLAALLAPPADVGLLRTGLDIADVPGKAAGPLATVIFPRIVTAREHSREAFGNALRSSASGLLIIVAPVTLMVIGGTPLAVNVLPSGYEDVVSVAIVLTIGFAVSASTIWVRHAIVALDRVRAQNIVGAVLVLLSVSAMVVTVPVHGAIGAALVMASFLVVYSSSSLAIAVHATRRFRG